MNHLAKVSLKILKWVGIEFGRFGPKCKINLTNWKIVFTFVAVKQIKDVNAYENT